MKYWRGYLTAAIVAACTWGLREFAKAHSALVDMIYPYATRMVQSFLADWSAGVDGCLWQILLVVLLALVALTVVLMVIFKWNPIQWFGWVCAAVAVVFLLNTGMYELNVFAGPLAEDVQLKETDYTVTELRNAAEYYRDLANDLAEQVRRDSNGDVVFDDFDSLAAKAQNGFDTLVYERSMPVFAGPSVPVKKLGWESWFTARGMTGLTVGLTGEAAVNPETPAILLPFAMCREMTYRVCIVAPRDATFGAWLACDANEDVQFRYSGMVMAYRYCLKALEELDEVTGASNATGVAALESSQLARDMAACDAFIGDGEKNAIKACDLLVSWHIQKVVIPSQVVEEDPFDPLDKEQVDLD